ncbi:hypothetical protein, partial [Pseudoflavonifractor capillosus]|uniref:hypothetical protein n=1 Tax=Pseudoflavonifractor capillosus TaxID=106588 RepID=UPI001957DF6F
PPDVVLPFSYIRGRFVYCPLLRVQFRWAAAAFPLAIAGVSCYNRREKQKCGSFRVGQHPETCAGASTTYTTAIRPHRMEYYTIVRPFL